MSPMAMTVADENASSFLPLRNGCSMCVSLLVLWFALETAAWALTVWPVCSANVPRPC